MTQLSPRKCDVIAEFIKDNPDIKSPAGIAERLKSLDPKMFPDHVTTRHLVAKSLRKQVTRNKPAFTPIATGRLTEDDIRKRHDIVFIVRDKAAQVPKGEFYTESDFIRFAGIRVQPGYRQALDHPDFAMYRGKAGGTTYWGHPDSIQKLKDEYILS